MQMINQALRSPTTESIAEKIADFADRMRSVPRRAVRCEIRDVVMIQVDRHGVMAIFRQAFGAHATPNACYEALRVLQDRLDHDCQRDHGRAAF